MTTTTKHRTRTRAPSSPGRAAPPAGERAWRAVTWLLMALLVVVLVGATLALTSTRPATELPELTRGQQAEVARWTAQADAAERARRARADSAATARLDGLAREHLTPSDRSLDAATARLQGQAPPRPTP
jgi:hypothetical protein